MSKSSFISGLVLLKWLRKSANFGDEFRSNEVLIVPTFSLLFLLNLSQEMVDKKQLLFKDTNRKIAMQQVAQTKDYLNLESICS